MSVFTIPPDLNRWRPGDAQRWLRTVEDDPAVTDEQCRAARRAVAAALLDEEDVISVFGPAT